MTQKQVSGSLTTMTDPNWDREQAGLTLSYNGVDQIKSFASTENTIVHTPRYDTLTGDLLSDEKGVRYDHDGLHKLRQLTDSNDKLLASYAYGSDGMRRSKQDGKTTLSYVYDNKQLLSTSDNHGNAAFYLFAKGREARLLLKAGQSQPSIRFYGYDNHSVSNTLDFNNQGQRVGIHYHHDEDYGQSLDSAKTQDGQALSIDYDPYSAGGFAEYAEQETQGRLQYRPAREYVASLHQFASLDTDNRFNNRYGYGEGNPRMKFDPSGNSALLNPWKMLWSGAMSLPQVFAAVPCIGVNLSGLGGLVSLLLPLAVGAINVAASPNHTRADYALQLTPLAIGVIAGGLIRFGEGKLLASTSSSLRVNRIANVATALAVGPGVCVGGYAVDKYLLDNTKIPGMTNIVLRGGADGGKKYAWIAAIMGGMAAFFGGLRGFSEGGVENEGYEGQGQGRQGMKRSVLPRRAKSDTLERLLEEEKQFSGAEPQITYRADGNGTGVDARAMFTDADWEAAGQEDYKYSNNAQEGSIYGGGSSSSDSD